MTYARKNLINQSKTIIHVRAYYRTVTTLSPH